MPTGCLDVNAVGFPSAACQVTAVTAVVAALVAAVVALVAAAMTTTHLRRRRHRGQEARDPVS